MNMNKRECPYCGEIINAKDRKCQYCGEYLDVYEENNSDNKLLITGVVILILCILTIVNVLIFMSPKYKSDSKINTEQQVEEQNTVQTSDSVQNQKNYNEILNKINRYQAQYWQIIERNDMFLRIYGDEEDSSEKDNRDLNRLENNVISQINKNNIYLKKYYRIINNYTECTGDTTYDMSVAAAQDFKAIDKLLNEVYQVVKTQLPPQDFEKLKQSEIKWIRHKEGYSKRKFEQDEYGSYGRCVGIKVAETSATEFRTLLLLLYL